MQRCPSPAFRRPFCRFGATKVPIDTLLGVSFSVGHESWLLNVALVAWKPKKKSEKAVSRFHHWLASSQRNKSQTAHLFIKEADNGLYTITIRTNWIPGACFVWSWWVQKQQKKNKKNTDAHAETSRLLCQLYDMAVFFYPHKWTVHRGASVFVIVCFVAAAIFYLRMVRINQIVRRASPPAPGVNANLSAAAADGRCN